MERRGAWVRRAESAGAVWAMANMIYRVGPSVGGRVGWCDAAMHNEIDSKCRAGTSRAFSSHHGAPVGKAPVHRSKLEIESASPSTQC